MACVYLGFNDNIPYLSWKILPKRFKCIASISLVFSIMMNIAHTNFVIQIKIDKHKKR